MASNRGQITQREMPLCRGEGKRRGQEARVAAYRGKMHGRKSVQGLAMARREFGELTGGELTRFDCICKYFVFVVVILMRPLSLNTLSNDSYKQ